MSGGSVPCLFWFCCLWAANFRKRMSKHQAINFHGCEGDNVALHEAFSDMTFKQRPMRLCCASVSCVKVKRRHGGLKLIRHWCVSAAAREEDKKSYMCKGKPALWDSSLWETLPSSIGRFHASGWSSVCIHGCRAEPPVWHVWINKADQRQEINKDFSSFLSFLQQ